MMDGLGFVELEEETPMSVEDVPVGDVSSEERERNLSVLSDLWPDVNLKDWATELLGGHRYGDPDFDPEYGLAHVPRTDIVLARTVRKKLGNRLTYISSSGKWYVWDGRIHRPQDSDTVAMFVVHHIFDVISSATDDISAYYEAIAQRFRGSKDPDDKRKLAEVDKKIKKVSKYERYRDSLGDTRGTISAVKALQVIFHQDSDYFDQDQDYFVVRNGVFHTKDFSNSGWPRLSNHDPSRPVSKYFDADWDPNSANRLNDSKWMAFLRSSTINGDEEIIEYTQKTCGAAFLGRNKLRTIINLIGPPSSGKSLFLETIFQSAGDYCSMPNAIAITRQQQNWEQSKFRGRRLIGISEPDSSKEVDDDFLKRFTGDIWVETRNLREKSQGWAPQGVLFIASNDYLKINTRDKAIVDRIQIISFPYHFVPNPDPNKPNEKQRNTALTDQLQTDREKSDILFWIVEGMKKFYNDGEMLIPPHSVREAADKVVTEGSAATRWIADQISEGNLVREQGEEVYHHITMSQAWFDFTLWNQMNNEHSRLSRTYFENDISQWYDIKKHGPEKYIVGLRKTNMDSVHQDTFNMEKTNA